VNREDKRTHTVLFIGGPADRQVLEILATRTSHTVYVKTEMPDFFGTEPLKLVNDEVKYTIAPVLGHLERWYIAWPAGNGERGFDIAMRAVYSTYSCNPAYSGSNACELGEEPERI
jgi:hypothetical protein